MAKLKINDLVEELSEENKRLLNDLIFSQKLIQFLENYRKYLISFNENCICDQNVLIRPKLDELEIEFKTINETIDRKQIEFTINQLKDKQFVQSLDSRIELSDNENNNRLDQTFGDKTNEIKVKSKRGRKRKYKCNLYDNYVCDWIGCGLSFKDTVSLRAHERRHTNGSIGDVDHKDTNSEEVNDFDGNQQNISNELTVKRVGNRVLCSSADCHMDFRRVSDMRNHYRRQHMDFRPYKCDECDKAFAMEKDLVVHKRKSTHKSIDSKAMISKIISKISDNSDETLALNVDNCSIGSVYPENSGSGDDSQDIWTSNNLKIRTKKKIKSENNNNGDISLSSNTNQRNTVSSDHNMPELLTYTKVGNRVPCNWPDCDMDFRKAYEMRNHYRRQHMDYRPYKCDECNKVFAMEKDLEIHKKKSTHKSVDNIIMYGLLGLSQDLNQNLKHYSQHMSDTEEDTSDKEFEPKETTVFNKDGKKYPCDWPDCTMTFGKPYEMRGHFRRKHINDRPHVCDECGLRFTIEKYLIKHKKVVHMSSKYVKSSLNLIKSKRISNKYRRMSNKATEQSYSCHWPGCDKVFTRLCDLSSHMQCVHSSERPYECDKCGKLFALKVYLQKHTKRLHNRSRKQTEPPNKHSEYRKRHTCHWPECGIRFRNLKELSKHYRSEHQNDQPFKCNECDKTYATQCRLDRHKALHNPVLNTDPANSMKLSICDWADCGLMFEYNYQLTAHIRKAHTKEKPFNCDICGKNFAMKYYLQKHRFRTHRLSEKAMEKHHICDEEGCGKAFNCQSALRVHKMTHKNYKPFRCEWPGCEMAFYVVGGLNAHRKTHTNVREFLCDYDNCSKAFKNSACLRKHKQSHLKVKRYMCSWPACEESFAINSYLIKHMNKHQGIRPYKCRWEGCPSPGFYCKKALRKHYRGIHKLPDSEAQRIANETQ